MSRIIFFSGKGGVGKTSVASAHALRAAENGEKTILVSADRAHNIGDVFQTETGPEIIRIEDNLDGLELDPDSLMKKEYPQATSAVWDLLGGSGFSGVDPGDDAFWLPGFEDLFSLLKIADLYKNGWYDKIIVDCAPTASTLSLLKMPELLQWYMERFSPVGKALVRMLAPSAKRKYRISLPRREAMNDMERIWQKLLELQDILKDPLITTVRLVCIPEKMIVSETKRDFMYLSLYRYPVDGIFINRILPEKTGNSFMEEWRKIQQKYIREYEEVFQNTSVFQLPWLSEEIKGQEAVKHIADLLPDEGQYRAESSDNEVFTKTEDGYCLNVRLPFVEEEAIDVFREGTDLFLTVRGWRRCIPLPNVLTGMELAGHTLQEGELRLFFRELTGRTGDAL